MIKQEQVTINGKDITVNELRVSQIIKITKRFPEFEGKELSDVLAILEEMLPLCIPDLTSNDLLDMTPTELKMLYESFKKANEVFFGMLDKAGILTVLAELKNSALESLNESFVELSRQDTPEP
jgi:hypothetical protein